MTSLITCTNIVKIVSNNLVCILELDGILLPILIRYYTKGYKRHCETLQRKRPQDLWGPVTHLREIRTNNMFKNNILKD